MHLGEIKKIKPVQCPICGEVPHILSLYEESELRSKEQKGIWNEYKVSCPNHHLDCGNWKDTKEEAWKDWERRIVDTTQPDFCFNDNHFVIQAMDVQKMADLLYRVQSGEFDFKEKKNIEEWLKKPVDGIYPKGYPGVPKQLQSQNTDILSYRKAQSKISI